MDLLTVSTRRRPNCTVVAGAGEVELTTVPALEAALVQALDDPSRTPVVVDLAAVEFCDSTGLHCLLRAREHARRRGVGLTITRPSAAIRRLFDVAGVAHVLLGPEVSAA